MAGAAFPPCWLFGLRHPSTEAYRLLGGARSWYQNGNLQESSYQWIFPTAPCVLVPTVSHSHPWKENFLFLPSPDWDPVEKGGLRDPCFFPFHLSIEWKFPFRVIFLYSQSGSSDNPLLFTYLTWEHTQASVLQNQSFLALLMRS